MNGLNTYSGPIPTINQGQGLAKVVGLRGTVNWTDLNELEATVLAVTPGRKRIYGASRHMVKAFVKDDRSAWFICTSSFFTKYVRKDKLEMVPKLINTRVGGDGPKCCSSGQCNMCKHDHYLAMTRKGMVRNQFTKFWEKKRS